MSLDGFLTFIGLTIASYAALNSINRLKLRLYIYRQLFIGLIMIFLILFLQFYSELKFIIPNRFEQIFKENLQGLSNQKASFLVAFMWIIFAYVFHKISRPHARNLKVLKILSERLHDEGRYLELIELVCPYLKIIKNITKEDKREYNRYLSRMNKLDKLAKGDIVKVCFYHRIYDWIKRKYCRITNLITNFISYIFGHQKIHDAALEIENLIFQSDGIRKLLLKLKPDVAIILLSREGEKIDKFRKRFFQDAIRDRSSHFYKELEETTYYKSNCNYKNRLTEDEFINALLDIVKSKKQHNTEPPGPNIYEIKSDSVLLTGFFKDANVAMKCKIWKAILPEVVNLISDQDYIIKLNSPYWEKNKWNDPIYNILHFCDIMIGSAIEQNILSHMGLPLIPPIVRELEKIHDNQYDFPTNESDYSTLSEFLINETTQRLQRWIKFVNELSEDNLHMNPNNILNGTKQNIFYWAVQDYIEVMEYILKSKRLKRRFIVEQLQYYIDTIGELGLKQYRIKIT